jgi:hypothetical protein
MSRSTAHTNLAIGNCSTSTWREFPAKGFRASRGRRRFVLRGRIAAFGHLTYGANHPSPGARRENPPAVSCAIPREFSLHCSVWLRLREISRLWQNGIRPHTAGCGGFFGGEPRTVAGPSYSPFVGPGPAFLSGRGLQAAKPSADRSAAGHGLDLLLALALVA